MTTYTRYMTPYGRAWDMAVYTEYMWSYDGICQVVRIPHEWPGPAGSPAGPRRCRLPSSDSGVGSGPSAGPPAGPAFIMCMYKYKTIWKNFTVMPVMLGLGNRTADGTSCTLHLES
jgi:hypothetical protein